MKSIISHTRKRKAFPTLTKKKLSRLNRLEILPQTHKFDSHRNLINLVPEILKIKSILVPIDFSTRSKKALHYATAFSEQFGAKLILLNVVEPSLYPMDGEFAAAIPPITHFMKISQEKLGHLAKQKLPQNLPRQVIVRSGQPFREIVEAARKFSCDVIIITTHGYTGLKHVLMGSTAERVVRHANCPVLVVR